MRRRSPEQASAALRSCGQGVAGPRSQMRLPQGWPGVRVPQLLCGHLHIAPAKYKTDLRFTSPCGTLPTPISLIAFVGL